MAWRAFFEVLVVSLPFYQWVKQSWPFFRSNPCEWAQVVFFEPFARTWAYIICSDSAGPKGKLAWVPTVLLGSLPLPYCRFQASHCSKKLQRVRVPKVLPFPSCIGMVQNVGLSDGAVLVSYAAEYRRLRNKQYR